MSSVVPSSTILPSFITAIREAILRTRFKSWEMNKIAIPVRF